MTGERRGAPDASYLFLGGVSDRDLDISTRGGARLAPFFRPLGVVGRGMRSETFGADLASMESHICLDTEKKIKFNAGWRL